MSNCLSHTGLYDDWDNPLTPEGQPYLPGPRLCKHRDCVNPDHIEGLGDELMFLAEANRPNNKRMSKAAQKVIYAKVVELGLGPKPEGIKVCQLSFCTRPHKARNLCMNHWMMFRRLSPESLKTIRRYSASDFQNIPDPVFKRKGVQFAKVCVFDSCGNKVKTRSLCDYHYRMYCNQVALGKIAINRPSYSLADFSHVPNQPGRKKPSGNCSMPDCSDPQSVKTLCENHYRTYLKLTKKEMS